VSPVKKVGEQEVVIFRLSLLTILILLQNLTKIVIFTFNFTFFDDSFSTRSGISDNFSTAKNIEWLMV